MLGKAKKPFPVIIVAPSGAGKTTICRYVMEKLANIRYSISATTRKLRKDELEGKDYYFLFPTTFQEWIQEDKFCEWAKVYDELYGTPKEPFTRYLGEGYNVLLAIDIQGARKIKLLYPEAISIFILPPSMAELENRLVKRATGEIDKRLGLANLETQHLDEFDYVVVNDELITAGKKVIAIITAEECRRGRL
ncbi:MAG: guanylate kinase [Candidatus Stahlbacteria bacterium]|nr:guanylate kinase [Candidatus Stahlbacteria bacterium]